MALLPILHFPDPRLRNKARPVTTFDENLKQLAADMLETMYDAPGIGLAATQVDQHIRLVVMDLSEEKNQPQCFVNPVVKPLTEELFTYEEGCLSVPETFDEVSRPARVLIEAQNLEGTPFLIEAEGILAICIQHELDHLEGKLFVDYLSPLKRNRAKEKILKRKKLKSREPENAAKPQV